MIASITFWQIGRFILFFSCLLARGLWCASPCLISCITFWTISAGFAVFDFKSVTKYWQKCWRSILIFGATLNGFVTIANGGYMPCLGNGPVSGIWIHATEAHLLLPLCDRFAGCSLGDCFLALGLIIGIISWTLVKLDYPQSR